uniref:Uncharacterized protein n=1 Tax=Ditylenchus dipsaci TaxID=166011 RepID=A0A915DD13_9BILA
MGTALLTDWFQELFDGDKAIFRPKHLQLQGLRQVPNDYMNQALVTYSSLISAQKIVLLDFMQLPNVSRHTAEEVAAVCTKIKTSTIMKWLHADSNAAFFGPRIFNIQVELLEEPLVDVIDALFEVSFWVDPRPASFFLLAHRNADSVYGESHGWPSLEVTGDGESIGRSAVNTITGEHMHVGVISNKDYTNTNAGGVQLAGDDLYLERYSGSLQQSALYILQESQKMQGPQEKIVPVVLRGD